MDYAQYEEMERQRQQELRLQAVQLGETLKVAVEAALSPFSSNEQRRQAHQVCEEFKDSSNNGIPCALLLAETDNSAPVRHFGLQAIEHFIKYRWNEIPENDRRGLKVHALMLIEKGTKDMLQEEQHIKDAVSRILVELIKREWPQHWRSLFIDLSQLCFLGSTQTEIVLQGLLRFSEDLVKFQNIPQARRRDLLHSINTTMPSIFQFFKLTMDQSLPVHEEHNGETSEKASRICEQVLDTLTGFVDWVPMNYIVDSDLLPLLCRLLLDQRLSVRASECLLLIVGRKTKLSERRPLMVMFSDNVMSLLLQAANNATEHIQESSNYLFLKRVSEILLEIGKQMCTLWGSTENIGQPPNFQLYLRALLAFTQHPSQSLRQIAFVVWLTLLRHRLAVQDEHFKAILPELIQCCTVSLHKVGFPSQNNHVSCDFSRIDFDTDEEFNAHLSALRNSVMDAIRLMTLMVPKMTFNVASSWLNQVLQKPIDVGNSAEQDRDVCNLSSPSFIEWDACSVFLEAVMSRLFQSQTGETPHVQEGISLLNQVLAFEVQDPLILSSVLSCISGLFPYVPHIVETLPQVLAKIFNAVAFNLPGQTKSTRSRAVRNVRVHACSVLVKICKNHPALLLPKFDHLYTCVQQLDSDKDQLSQMEKIILTEALIIVSNQFNDFARQSALIEELILPVKQLWSSPDFVRAISSPNYLMSYVGLDQPAVEPSSADTCGIHRSHITFCINTILAIIKRSEWPKDFNLAQRGGFVVHGENVDILRNPATQHICPLLDNLVTLLKTSCCLFKPAFMNLRHSDFLKAYDLMEHDRLTILGVPPTCTDNSDALFYRHPLERMQNFITVVFEYGFHILGNASQFLGAEFYSIPGLAQAIVDNLSVHFTLLPDYRARLFIRNFIKPFIQCCPRERFADVAVPVLTALCPEMFQRLNNRWQEICKKLDEQTPDNNQEDPESQEVLEEQLVRLLSREYMELIALIIWGKSVSSEVKEEAEMEEADNTANNLTFRELGTLGQAVLHIPVLFQALTMCVLTGFSWPDTIVCHKCSSLLWPLIKQMVINNEMPEQGAMHVFMCVLSGLQVHGQHESCHACLITLTLIVYEALRLRFPSLTHILQQIPEVNRNQIRELNRIMSAPQRAGYEKKKKDLIKKITTNIIGGTYITNMFNRLRPRW